MTSGVEADATRSLAVGAEVVHGRLHEPRVVGLHERRPQREAAALPIAQAIEDQLLGPLPSFGRIILEAGVARTRGHAPHWLSADLHNRVSSAWTAVA